MIEVPERLQELLGGPNRIIHVYDKRDDILIGEIISDIWMLRNFYYKYLESDLKSFLDLQGPQRLASIICSADDKWYLNGFIRFEYIESLHKVNL